MGRFGILLGFSVFFQPLRNYSRVIWKSEDVSLQIRGLVRPVPTTAHGLELCLSCEEICTSAEFIESIRIAMSLEWAYAGMRYYD